MSNKKLTMELDAIQSWLSDTTEPYDDWVWDGDELIIFLNEQVAERYNKETVYEEMINPYIKELKNGVKC